MASGRYAKITINSNHGDWLTGMTSLHICDANGVKWNDETMPHTCGGGTLITGCYPKDCSDTNAANYWQIYNTFPSWWKVDLGTVRNIAQIKTRSVVCATPDRGIKDFTLSLSDNDVDWTVVYTGVTSKNTDEQIFYLIFAIAPDPLSVTAALSGAPGVEIPSLELSASADLDAADVLYGYFVAPDPLEISAGLSASLAHALPAPALEAAAGLEASLALLMPAPLFEVIADMDVEKIGMGFFLSPDPLEVTPGLTATLAHKLPAPVLEAAAALSASLKISLPAALEVLAGLAAPGVLMFWCDEFVVSYLFSLIPQAGSGYSTLTIPISSFQGRFKSGDPSYLSVVVPGDDYATDISNRADPVNPPELAVYMRKTFPDGNAITEKIMGVDLEDVAIDEGSTSYSITLSGHRTTTYSAKAITLAGASYKNLTGGKTRYRCAPDLYLRPGDTVTVNGDTFVADNISIAISVESQTMEVAEA